MTWTKWLATLGLALALSLSSGALLGCEQDAGDHFEDAAESVGEGIEEGADEIEDAFD